MDRRFDHFRTSFFMAWQSVLQTRQLQIHKLNKTKKVVTVTKPKQKYFHAKKKKVCKKSHLEVTSDNMPKMKCLHLLWYYSPWVKLELNPSRRTSSSKSRRAIKEPSATSSNNRGMSVCVSSQNSAHHTRPLHFLLCYSTLMAWLRETESRRKEEEEELLLLNCSLSLTHKHTITHK